MEERDKVIALLEEVETSLEDLRDAHFSNLQAKVAETRDRLIKEALGLVYCLDDDAFFDWRDKTREVLKPLKSYQLTLEIEIMAQNECDAQMNAKEMVDGYLDNKAKLSLISTLVEVMK